VIELQIWLLLSLVIIVGVIAAAVSFFLLSMGRLARKPKLTKYQFGSPERGAGAREFVHPRTSPRKGRIIPWEKGAA
jgi:hypothetical protein